MSDDSVSAPTFASTLPSDPAHAVASDKTCRDLDWHRVVEAVTARCVGPRAQHGQVPIATTREGTERALAETSEAWSLLEAGEPLPLDGLRDVRPHLERVERQGALDAPGLQEICTTLAAARVLRKFLRRHKEQAPRLADACALDPSLDRLEDELGAAVAPEGRLVDEASPELARLRTEVGNLRERLIGRLETLIHKHADILQDRYYTIREGRYVLPVRTDAHERFPGIVHGTSASGATVFVEPRPLITQGNRLRMAQAEMEREEQRLLAELTELVRERLAALWAAVDALDHADLRAACAKLGRDTGGTVLRLADEGRIQLPRARHPLLVIDGLDVVANDLELEGGRGLVISGPNAGGKTVALKCLGLAAIMTRAGVPFPCAEGGECGLFGPVLTDVGDQQSITTSLSSFSAHVTNLVEVLEHAGTDSLVLLDELAHSTDPQEGAALACAVVDALCDAGAAVAATTHYEPLKSLAARDARMRNASVGFDVDRMRPTFELALDMPGSSSALAVAQRFGVPEAVIARAKEMLPEQAHDFEALVHELTQRRRELDDERAAIDREYAQARSAREKAEEREQSMRDKNRREIDDQAHKLLESVRRARQEVEGARKRVRNQAVDDRGVREARDTVDAAARALDEAQQYAGGAAPAGGSSNEVSVEGEAGEPVDPGELHAGDRVWVPRLRSEGEVVETAAKGRIRVSAGALKLWVDASEVSRRGPNGQQETRSPEASRSKEAEGRARTAADEAAAEDEPAKPRATPDNTLDIRGMRVDDALSMLESFVDRLYGASEPAGFVVHGVGSGALRDAVRDHLRREQTCVAHTRAGELDEGGDRITVFFVR